MEEAPKLRYVEAFPVETDRGDMIALRDPYGITSEIIFISQAAVLMLQFFDGRASKKGILAKSQQLFGITIPGERFEELIGHLDENYLLDNERYRTRVKELESTLLHTKVRPAAYAGTSYPAEKNALIDKLESFFTDGSGAGMPGPVNGLPAPKGIISPHIDLRIGGPTYSHAYRCLAESPPSDVYIILGTGHAGLSDVYSVLPVDFDTPLGRVKTDTAFIDKLQNRYKHNLFTDMFLHRTEHTIEFQTIFIKKILGNRPCKIIPILCSFSYHTLLYDQYEREKEIIGDFSDALRETIQEYPGTVTVIASIDLAHVGPRYGETMKPDKAFLQEVKRHDFRALESALNMNIAGWLEMIANIEDRYRICGFSPVYTLLSSIDAKKGELLRYDQGLMDDMESYVSYCSAVFY